jgi:alkylation response protein AidB-like acyl-CoA dehydrogenase
MSSGALAPAECLARSEGPAISLLGRGGIAAMQLGVSEAVRDMIVEYAKVRETFGRPIGSYQAVRHPCAEMALRCEASRAQLFVAAISLRDGLADAALQINAAKLIANDAAIKNVGTNLQLHGGIGTTDEHDAHLFLKRAHMTARWFGGDKVVLKEILAVPFAA